MTESQAPGSTPAADLSPGESAPPGGPTQPDPGGRKSPAGPAWGIPDPGLDALVEYFAANAGTFTNEALVAQAESAGNSREVMNAALAQVPARLDRPRLEQLKEISRRMVWIAYSLGFVALVVGTANQSYIRGLEGIVIIGQLGLIAIAAALSLAAVRNRISAPRRTVAALASLLVIPLAVFLVFPGLCIYGFITSHVGQ